MNKRILIIDDHPIVAEGVESLLNRMAAKHSITKVKTGTEALSIIKKKNINVAIVDYSLPDINGTELIHRLQETAPKMRTVIYTEHDEPWVINELLATGADAVVLKSDDMEELVVAVESVSIGLPYLSKRFTSAKSDADRNFTPREIDILQLICSGLHSRDIAETLCISEHTVDYHRKKLIHKLGATNNTHLVSIAVASGLVKPENNVSIQNHE